jgi:glycosyltransferase involved in cell wall biosynthesis
VRARRVLFLINSLGAGGAERSLAELLAPLSAGGVEPLVACFKRTDEGSEAEVRGAGVDVRIVAGGGLASRARHVRRLVDAFEPHIVHTTIFEADVVGRVAAARRPAAVVTSLVNTSYDPVRRRDPNVRPSKLRVAQAIDSWTARHLTDHFHAITDAVKAAAVRDLRIPPARITVIERGRDVGRLGRPGPDRTAASRLRLGLGADDLVVVNVGRQEFQKGHDVLVDAFDRLAAAHPRLVLLQAGRRGAATAALEARLARSPASERFRLLGHRDDIGDVLAAADVFVFPSRYEGLGGAVLEAMALGLPIVASDIPALREVLEPDANADLVAVGDPEALATAIDRLLRDPERRRRHGRRSLERFGERYTLERCAARTLELYDRVAG